MYISNLLLRIFALRLPCTIFCPFITGGGIFKLYGSGAFPGCVDACVKLDVIDVEIV